ncbi:MAG TPA: hypothetical protein DDY70_01495 [Clostridiales bacterium]|nr:hypothetical protein [Clostridiales bacterium]
MKQLTLPRVILLLLALATLCFIFARSTKAPADSAAESDKVRDFLEDVLPPDSETTDFVLTNVRKIAHFSEFGLLGILTVLFAATYRLRAVFLGRWFVFGFFAAFFDETIQMFTSRGPAIADVWIDVGGYIFYSLLTLLILTPVLAVRRRPLFTNRYAL